MTHVRLWALTIVLLIIATPEKGVAKETNRLFDRAKGAFVEASALVESKRYTAAKRRLDALWRTAPPGSAAWYRARPADKARNFGSPPFYYALRMLTDIVDWRTRRGGKSRANADPVQLTALLIPRSQGLQPRNRRELERGKGTRVINRLDKRMTHAPGIFEDSLWLFAEYVSLLTDGRLHLQTDIVTLHGLTVPVRTAGSPRRFAGLDSKAWRKIWRAVGSETRDQTDWWWVLYPSHVPSKYPDFKKSEFITGGMGLGPKGEPVFIIDDLWLLRKPPHLGRGPYSDLEHRAYLPQWLQHEFFHHLFRLYPHFGLEAKSHQWFDRNTWPSDFKGHHEADYFHEALHKRLLNADPPLYKSLRYARIVPASITHLTPADIAGTYRREPVENDWHVGKLTVGRDDRTVLWRNRADASWRLHLDTASGRLVSGPDNPYFDTVAELARDFTLVLEENPRGRPTVTGFRFQGELYRRD